MAELTVRANCRSAPCTIILGALDFTFPLWGLAAPLLSVLAALSLLTNTAAASGKGAECAAWMASGLCLTAACLMLKRTLSLNAITVNRRGLELPLLLGSGIHVLRNIGWSKMERLTAVVTNDDLRSARLIIVRKGGRKSELPLNLFDRDFTEQFVLAVQHWAPHLYNESLENLQNALRIEGEGNAQIGYTELWEEELSRRFSPTSYVPLEPGRILRNNSLRVVSELASGGLSALYLCQLDGRKLVVLKEAVIPQLVAEGIKDKAKELFEREATVLIKLDHPGIVHVIDCFSEIGRNYLILEYVNGADLRQLVKQNGIQKEEDVLEWALQIANALKYLHEREQPIVHRDLTPDNIVLRNDGKVIIVDFGAANEYIGTATGTFVGKQAYIAPEQIRGKATPQSDIYTFGCTLFFLLTGTEPEALSPSDPRSVNPAVSEELAEIVVTCTQLEAESRYQNVAQLIPILRRLSALSLGA